MEKFFSMDFKHWLFVNLSNIGGFGRDQIHRDILFDSLLWCLWKKRNEWIFGGQDRSSWLVLQRNMGLQQELVATSSPSAADISRRAGHVSTPMHWVKPPRGWCKLNVDVSVGSGSGSATCGGLIAYGLVYRDSSLLIESDCLEAVNLVTNRNSLAIVPSLIHYIAKLMDRAWSVKLCHIGRDRIADWMTKQALSSPDEVEALLFREATV
ncbi:hypothetical protein V6N11_044991 [Hibiscus sabdariffa]|uniref:RNase H type-1 domain-containing protein n=1 Tax=Hibiscus sabdariffa TaxID=183260 RepID=A0ABR2PUL5_9ROSI